MEIRKEFKILVTFVVVFLAIYFLPIHSNVFNTAMDATFDLSKWYAREHVVLCLLPAFLIAGVISVLSVKAPLSDILEQSKNGLPIRWLLFRNCSGGLFLHDFTLASSIHKRGAGLDPLSLLYSVLPLTFLL